MPPASAPLPIQVVRDPTNVQADNEIALNFDEP
jgi:hypothetical protein